jgi:hypothetical protein
MQNLSPEMRACIEECLRCHSTCLGMDMNHCLVQGGKRVEPQHFRLMMACAEICQTSANFMLIGTPPSQAHLPRVRGNLRGVRALLRERGRHGGLRAGVPTLC